ncbi:MAG: autotransporter domain-containing protein [Proteobacteria bacterium]|nr:autotransporter domain-containing protein [Pseudomonadota bacterium]
MTRRGALAPGELAACVDGTWDAARLGIAAGYSNGHTRTDGKSSEIDADTFRLAAYGSAPLGGFNLKGGASIGWRYLFEGDAVKAALQLPTGSNFVSEGLPIAESSLTLGLGVEARLQSGTTIGIVYQGDFADNASNHSAQG